MLLSSAMTYDPQDARSLQRYLGAIVRDLEGVDIKLAGGSNDFNRNAEVVSQANPEGDSGGVGFLARYNNLGDLTDVQAALENLGLTDLQSLTIPIPVVLGGTGATTASGARTNLGLGTIATQAASNVAITGGSITGITDLAIADGGTAASTAIAALANLKGIPIGGTTTVTTKSSGSGTHSLGGSARFVAFIMVGGGGGGGGAYYDGALASTRSSGSGGGGGATVIGWFAVQSGVGSLSYSIGAGGSAGTGGSTGGAGGDGSDTTLTYNSVTATATGGGGGPGAANLPSGTPTSGGVGSGSSGVAGMSTWGWYLTLRGQSGQSGEQSGTFTSGLTTGGGNGGAGGASSTASNGSVGDNGFLVILEFA